MNFPAVGWVITISWSARILPPPTGISPVDASAFPPPPPAPVVFGAVVPVVFGAVVVVGAVVVSAGRSPPVTSSPYSLTFTATGGSGWVAGPLLTEPSSLNLLPWHGQSMVPVSILSTRQPWCVHTAEKPL